MSRFVNLEFNDESEQFKPKAGLKGEAYYCERARTAFEEGEFESALRLYSKVLEFNPGNVGAWAGQVRMLIELGEFQEAKLWADKAVDRFPRDPELLAAKAVTLARIGDLDAALTFSDAAIEERGETPYLWLARADVLLARQEQRADYCIDKAQMLAPGDWFIAWLCSRVGSYYKQFALALKHAQQAIEWNAGHFTLWLELSRCQQALGLFGPARTSLAQARQLNPQCRQASMAMAALANRGIPGRLLGWWRRLLGS